MERSPIRPWMIVIAGLIGAALAAAALCLPELAAATRGEVAPGWPQRAPALITAFLAVYALIALLLSTAAVIAALARLRRRLAPMLAYRGPQRPDWTAPFDATGMLRLLPALAAGQGPSAQPPAGAAWLQQPVDRMAARGEAARLHYLALARSHFLTALILLAAVVALGLAQDYLRFALAPQAVPTAAAVLIVIGLVLLTALARLALDATVEPLTETMAQIPVERLETGLLRRAVELLEAVGADLKPVAETVPAAAAPLPDRLLGAVEAGQRAVVEAAEKMTATTGALAAAARSSAETVETTLRAIAARPEPTAAAAMADEAGLAQLRGAVEGLTALLERLSAERAEEVEDAVPSTEIVARPRGTPQLARELKQLLREIDAA
jgi:hypothetical protein